MHLDMNTALVDWIDWQIDNIDSYIIAGFFSFVREGDVTVWDKNRSLWTIVLRDAP